MRFVVLGGSPKGEVSVTLQAVYWLREQYPQHEFVIHCVARDIKKLERDEVLFWSVVEELAEADGILWAYPLYYGLVHSGLKRFIELLNERTRDGRVAAQQLVGKHTALYSTSIHFYDHTALEYMRGVCEDMGLQVDDGFPAAMRDLLSEEGRRQLRLFFEKWARTIEGEEKKGRLTAPLSLNPVATLTLTEPPAARLPLKVGIVTESGQSANLDQMVAYAARSFVQAEIIDLAQLKIAGPCLGCLRCGYDNQCVYEGKDDVIAAHRRLKECDALLFCGSVKDRYLSARWTSFINRLFFSTHIPFYSGKTVGYIFAGPYRQLPAMRDIFNGLFSCFEMRVAGVVTDEDLGDTIPADNVAAADGTAPLKKSLTPAESLVRQLDALCASLQFHYAENYCQPANFHAVGGKHIFRDEIFANLKGVFCADHKYYKRNGLYDFPQKRISDRVAGTMMYLGMKLGPMRKEVQTNMAKYMVKPYEGLYQGENKPVR